MKLYDHRLTKRGALQSYEGHVNSHTRIQLGVDESERFVMSGSYQLYKCHTVFSRCRNLSVLTTLSS